MKICRSYLVLLVVVLSLGMPGCGKKDEQAAQTSADNANSVAGTATNQVGQTPVPPVAAASTTLIDPSTISIKPDSDGKKPPVTSPAEDGPSKPPAQPSPDNAEGKKVEERRRFVNEGFAEAKKHISGAQSNIETVRAIQDQKTVTESQKAYRDQLTKVVEAFAAASYEERIRNAKTVEDLNKIRAELDTIRPKLSGIHTEFKEKFAEENKNNPPNSWSNFFKSLNPFN